MTKKSEKSTVKHKLHFTPLSSNFSKNLMKNSESTDSKTSRTKISEKIMIRLTIHDFQNCKLSVFGTFSKEMTILKIKCFLKNFQEAEKN